jgi:hypothetical protein
MRHSIDPRQTPLFDPDLQSYSDVALDRLQQDWPGIFRKCILELMPVDVIEKRFAEVMGRPTKELYSMCGLVFLMEFRDWTTQEAADSYLFDQRVHFALNLGHDRLTMTTRTIERYRALFREEDAGEVVMERVTQRLVELLNLSVKKQRLDSTHVFSNMALFGRTRLMQATIRRFLTQLKRHDAELFAAVPEALRLRHESKSWEFGGGKEKRITREQAAEDMLWLIRQFEDVPHLRNRNSFKDLVRVFNEQCELRQEKVIIREKVGGDAMQNPSDPDATRDGHKGPGYQAQVSETCAAENEVQLVVAALPQTACEADQKAVTKVLDQEQEKGYVPEELVADGGYGSDDNHQECQTRKVNLLSPVNPGCRKEERLALEDFKVGPDRRICCCPAGRIPVTSRFDDQSGNGCATFEEAWCNSCEMKPRCPVVQHRLKYRIQYNDKDLRLAQRRVEFKTPECRFRYALRSGVEGTFSRVKAITGLGRLRVRGIAAVSMAIYLKLAGLNILRALGSKKLRDKIAAAMSKTAMRRQNRPYHVWFTLSHELPVAA